VVRVDVFVRGYSCVILYDVNNLGPFCVVDSSVVYVFSGLGFRVSVRYRIWELLCYIVYYYEICFTGCLCTYRLCVLPVCATVCCSCGIKVCYVFRCVYILWSVGQRGGGVVVLCLVHVLLGISGYMFLCVCRSFVCLLYWLYICNISLVCLGAFLFPCCYDFHCVRHCTICVSCI
jgi:hypothetical protein